MDFTFLHAVGYVMTEETLQRARAMLVRFYTDDSLVALELLAMDADIYPEVLELRRHLEGIHMALAVLKVRALGVQVERLTHGYLLTPPK